MNQLSLDVVINCGVAAFTGGLLGMGFRENLQGLTEVSASEALAGKVQLTRRLAERRDIAPSLAMHILRSIWGGEEALDQELLSHAFDRKA